MTVGDRIREARTSKKTTQRELGEKLGVSQQQVALYEKSGENIRYDTVKRIADMLEVDVNWLWTGHTLSEMWDAYGEFLARGKDKTPEGKARRNELGKKLAEMAPTFKIVETSISDAESRLNVAFNQLNGEGQRIAVERVEELTEIPKYQKMMENDEPESKD